MGMLRISVPSSTSQPGALLVPALRGGGAVGELLTHGLGFGSEGGGPAKLVRVGEKLAVCAEAGGCRQAMFVVAGVGNDDVVCPGGECANLNTTYILDPGSTELTGACTLPFNPNDADYICTYRIDFSFCGDTRAFELMLFGFLGTGWHALAGYKSPGRYNETPVSTYCVIWRKFAAGTGIVTDYSDTLTVSNECASCALDCDWDKFQPLGTYSIAISII